MPAKITLAITQGKFVGTEFVFEERTTCIIGRAEDCAPRVPNDLEHRVIGRHHCLLDINPPDIRIRDFGSLNGTYVNGKLIGRREKGMSAEEGARMQFPEHDLQDGDLVTLGRTVLRISVFVPTYCAVCSREIPEEDKVQADVAPGIYHCSGCRERARQLRAALPLTKAVKACAKCGRDVSAEIGENRQGEFICLACRENPLEIMSLLLQKANTATYELRSIAGHTIERELGRGGMGAVYLARENTTGKLVALKVMLPRVALDERGKEMFLRETENTKALKHPNVVQVWTSGCAGGIFFFTLEYCDGGSVKDLMNQRGGTLSIAEAGQIILQTLDALDYAHNAEIPCVKLADGRYGPGRGLVHRDVKPQNIFLTGSDSSRVAKVGDYGLAKAFDTAGLSGQTRTGSAAGTPYFMPRQQVVNFKYAKPEVNVWATAASFYTMLTGGPPRDFHGTRDMWHVVLESTPVPVRQRDSSIPKKLAEVIDLALIDRPQIHFKSAAEFKHSLESVL